MKQAFLKWEEDEQKEALYASMAEKYYAKEKSALWGVSAVYTWLSYRYCKRSKSIKFMVVYWESYTPIHSCSIYHSAIEFRSVNTWCEMINQLRVLRRNWYWMWNISRQK